ncbi:MAG: adenosylcobinamide-GDP ribazoletransferase [Ectothiorhodospira sp.]
MKPFLVALRFLTRFPVTWNDPTPQQVGRSLLYYPLVGLLMGAALAVAMGLLGTGPLAAALVVALWVVLTGLMHMDGLADAADAWIGGIGDRERTLEIMKDPRCGPAAVAVLILVLLVKYAALLELAGQGAGAAVLLAPFLGRAALPLLFVTTPYVRPGGMGSLLAEYLPRQGAWGVVFLAVAGTLLGGLWFGMAGPVLAALAGALGVFLAGRAWMRHRIGGTTGDTAGALVELVETGVLVAVALAVI